MKHHTPVVLAWTALLWRPVFGCRAVSEWIALLGRNSLLAYVAHVFTEIPALEYVWATWPPPAVRVGVAVADLAALVLLAAAVEADVARRIWAALVRGRCSLPTRGHRPAWALPSVLAIAAALSMSGGTASHTASHGVVGGEALLDVLRQEAIAWPEPAAHEPPISEPLDGGVCAVAEIGEARFDGDSDRSPEDV